jgi:Tol biopolymer transport system component
VGAGWTPALSADGRWVAFQSNLDLEPSDGNTLPDVYVRDTTNGALERISVSAAGTDSDAPSRAPALSPDGRFVVFMSWASNLAPVTNNRSQIFVRDRLQQTTECVSLTPWGDSGNADAYFGSISADGRFVAFTSVASNIVPGDSNHFADVFVRDRAAGTTVCASVDTLGVPRGAMDDNPLLHNRPPAISADGRYVAFSSGKQILASLPYIGTRVYLRDVQLGVTECVSVNSSGALADASSWMPDMSPDARFIAFTSAAGNLAPISNSGQDVYLHDRLTGVTLDVSLTSAGAASNGGNHSPAITPDGRFVAFTSRSSNIVPGDTNANDDVFLRDVVNGTTTRVSVDSSGLEGALGTWMFPSAVSHDGRFVAFSSPSPELAPFASGSGFDVFLHDRATTVASYCGNDGHAAHACPCANGSVGRGCANSAFASGAKLGATGDTSVSNDTLRLDAISLTGNLCIFYLGDAALNRTVFDDGQTCVGGAIVRVAKKPVGASASVYPEPGDLPLSLRAGVPAVGGRRFVQCVYRNAAAFCTSATSNRTNAVGITFVP